jgi:hypothetical protein
MSYERRSVAMTGSVHLQLARHLLRQDGQEDVCLATYRPSTGIERWSALLRQPVMPSEGDRLVHGNASFTTGYVLRAAAEAAADGCGVVALHAHPVGQGWQQMSGTDEATEAGYANLAREITGLPLVGMTLAGDERWSARVWNCGVGRQVAASHCENVRVLHPDRLLVSWNDAERGVPKAGSAQVRTVTCWGDAVQADLARLRVLVVGAGSVGMPVAISLAATGIESVATMDYDTIKNHNLDRLIGATTLDAYLRRSKASLSARLMADAATSQRPKFHSWEHSVCEEAGLRRALDFDVVFSCVDRPWARHVLNAMAYADLIPVIDGGVHADSLPEGGMRGAMWRSHVAGPGRICLACNGQYHPSHVMMERDGSLDDSTYISQLPEEHPLRVRQNVSTLSINCAGALLAQFISLVVRPGGLGDPGPIRYHLAVHWLQHDEQRSCIDGCPYPRMTAVGDGRPDPAGRHADAENERGMRARARRDPLVHLVRIADDTILGIRKRLRRWAARRLE